MPVNLTPTDVVVIGLGAAGGIAVLPLTQAGIEGRIGGLKRRHKLDRCRYHGDDGMERWVGWAIITHNLRAIAQTLVDRKKHLTIHAGFTSL